MTHRIPRGASTLAVLVALVLPGPIVGRADVAPTYHTGTPHAMPTLSSGLGGCCLSAPGGNLAYEGGAVQVAPLVYLDFAGSQWQDGFTDSGGYTSATAMQYLTGFFAGVGGTSWNGSQTQYCMGPAVPQGTTDCTGLTTTGYVGNPSSVYGGS